MANPPDQAGKARHLLKTIGELRNDPGVDVRTIGRVVETINELAGQRTVLAAGHARRARLAQARALHQPGPIMEASARIAAGLGVSLITGWRYAREVRNG